VTRSTTAAVALLLAAGGTGLHAAGPVTWPEWPPPPQWAESRPWREGPQVIERASFGALDINYDFFLSREEAAASPAVEANFGNADLDGDGRLAPLEFNNLAFALADRQ
jgi:hypothetical protein